MILNSLKKFLIGGCTGNIFMLNCFTMRYNSILLWSCIFTTNGQHGFSHSWHFHHVQFIMLFFRSSVFSEHSRYMQDLEYQCGVIVIVIVCCCFFCWYQTVHSPLNWWWEFNCYTDIPVQTWLDCGLWATCCPFEQLIQLMVQNMSHSLCTNWLNKYIGNLMHGKHVPKHLSSNPHLFAAHEPLKIIICGVTVQ